MRESTQTDQSGCIQADAKKGVDVMKRHIRKVCGVVTALVLVAIFASMSAAAPVTWWYNMRVHGTRYLYNQGTGQVEEKQLYNSGLGKITFDPNYRGGKAFVQTPVLSFPEVQRNGNHFSGTRIYAGMVYEIEGTFSEHTISGNVDISDPSAAGNKGYYKFHFSGKRKQ
ncbi:MAG: hypothetical protein U9R40_04660 [Synergistota bacterium]|nr:hypothetical protein [Synergistota bacterium]